tara:strand:+ start:854 stop:1234 length:381 start_codon:yes stop_codon:yes gene_type:complete
MFYKNEKGSYTVEFSLLLPLVVIIVVFFVEISHYNYVRHISTQAVVATCGEGYEEDIAYALPDCETCYSGLEEDTGYYYCSFYDEVEPLVGLIPDAMRPIEIRIDTLQRKTTELRELLEQLEQLGD